ncbi:anti-sigma factor family protein [Paraflavitalea pollutisoli]|uniref:anti-sigma factor family protein n=1 Tax=Paraflavitalea pollutisoli TaxID=3034143 RepID=UPI0023ED36D2|nr:hypothetical protein [Paraflavitalea sp. H1-2-19X]
MNITRHNYEEYFLLYVDNELNIVQRKAVEAFVAENPDLRTELEMLQDVILPADNAIVFQDKTSLLRTSVAPNPVNDTNCEEYFILYADDELTNEQKDQVEQFVYRNPQHQAGFELLQKVKLMPDASVVFPDKYALYRHEEEEKRPVVAMRWYRMMAAAAVLLLVGGTTWYLATKEPGGKGEFVRNTEKLPTSNNGGQQQLAAADSNKATQKNAAADHQLAATDQPAVKTTTDQQAVNTPADKAPNRLTPVISNKQDMAVHNGAVQQKKNGTKKVGNRSNIQDAPSVLPIDNDEMNGADRLAARGTASMKKADATTRPNTGEAMDEKAIMNSLALNNPPIIEPGGPDYPVDDRKNPMRGFFRKVSRVFDKATNADPDQTKNSIRIASFEIALK